jgi:hypothetical protein
MFVCCQCCVLSGRGLCDKLITRPEESYRLWCVVVCDLESSRMRRPWPALGRSATAHLPPQKSPKVQGNILYKKKTKLGFVYRSYEWYRIWLKLCHATVNAHWKSHKNRVRRFKLINMLSKAINALRRGTPANYYVTYKGKLRNIHKGGNNIH